MIKTSCVSGQAHIAELVWPSYGPHNPLTFGPVIEIVYGFKPAQIWFARPGPQKGRTWATHGPAVDKLSYPELGQNSVSIAGPDCPT